MRNCFHLAVLIALLSLTGCATTADLNAVRSELNRGMEDKLTAVDASVAALKKELEKNSEALAQTRKGNANTGADITELRDNFQQLRGQVEALRKDMTRSMKKEEEYKDKFENILLKINFIENFLEIGKKDSLGESGDKGKSGGSAAAKDPAKKQDKEHMYSTSYQLFKEGNYDKARTEFQNFLALYPDSEYSDNAQFWIGECYFFEKNYEKAILEYEKVTKNFPGGNKVPYALLKQGLSFLKLNDKTSAKLLLQQVIKAYPNTNQARMARTKLQEIK
ncbi:MAG: tol-pal system protein YbgF [Deltaproteobacteria bacterium HGW-Deltaproteobacteria-10]|nr:MAG: tol-pal system protein YbgF [Deltaproteobacteria bacterium HGW-Deltaproteobacteria-10]